MTHDEAAGPGFDLSGGALCLDFANTLDDRPDSTPNESLRTYADLLAFARATASLDASHLALLDSEARRRPADAERALVRIGAVREVIYRLFLALADGAPVPTAELAALNDALAEALGHARVVPASSTDHQADCAPRFALTWATDPVDLAAPLWPVVRSAADLLTSTRLTALRLCASETCAWLFLDTSRNGSRRWCSMKTCGNRAKARRHHARIRAATGTVRHDGQHDA